MPGLAGHSVPDGFKSAGHVTVACLPVGHRQADGPSTVDRRSAHPCLAAVYHAAENPVCCLVILEPEEHLVDQDVVEDVAAGYAGQALGERPGVRTGPLHQFRDALLPEGSERRVDGEPPGSPREGRSPVHSVSWLPGTARNGIPWSVSS